MISIEGHEKTPAIWPGGSLASHGLNPYGQCVWRVVWSESRNYMFGGRWADGTVGYRWIPLYMKKKCYLLEKWLPPYQYAKCTEEQWKVLHRDPDTGLVQLGPYPSQGEYYGPFWEFEGYPTLGAVNAVIDIYTRTDNMPESEKQALVIKAQEQELKEEMGKVEAAKEIILDCLPLSLTTGKLTDRFYRDATDIPERLSAQDVHKLNQLPFGTNKVFTGGRV